MSGPDLGDDDVLLALLGRALDEGDPVPADALASALAAFAEASAHGGNPSSVHGSGQEARRRLEDAGLDVTAQYGVGRYRLDFAVRHPKHPGRFVLAVEADGAAYHSGVVARERARLRQAALEARGWTFVRIWSTDFFRDPDTQIRRVLDAYEHALAHPPAQVSRSSPRRLPRPRT